MCRERNNFPELSVAVTQIKRRTDNILADIQEWKNYSIQQNQGQVGGKLELAEERFYEALKVLEQALGAVNQSFVKDNEEVTITLIRK